jgi:hypothetical protein
MKQTILITMLCFISGTLFSVSAQETYKHPRFRVSASGGLGYMIAKGTTSYGSGDINKEKIKKFERDLRWSPTFNADAHYLLDSDWGIGAKYIFATGSAEGEGFIFDPYDAVHYQVGDVSEKQFINYAGPSFYGSHSLGSNENLYLISSYSIGYAWLRDETSLLMTNMLTTAGNLAMNYEIGLDYLFHRTIGIGVNLGGFLCHFRKIKQTDGSQTQTTKLEKDDSINVSNINLTVGIRYYINN